MSTLTADLVEAGTGLPEVCGVFALRNISSQVDGCYIFKGTEGLRVATDGGEPVVIWETVALGSNLGFLRHRALMRPGDVPLDALGVLVHKPQTAFGLALKLDEWEKASGRSSANVICAARSTWDTKEYAAFYLPRMTARIETVGMDHAIRRAMGWKVEPGTLAKFWHHKALGVWMMQHESIPKPERWDGWGEWDGAWSFPGVATAGLHAETAIPGIHAGPPEARELRTPAEALRAICAEVCS